MGEDRLGGRDDHLAAFTGTAENPGNTFQSGTVVLFSLLPRPGFCTVTAVLQLTATAGTNTGFVIRDANEAASGQGATQTFNSREASRNRPTLVLTFS